MRQDDYGGERRRFAVDMTGGESCDRVCVFTAVSFCLVVSIERATVETDETNV
jgi:hypothetical protein